MTEQPRLTHVDEQGAARMVDVSGKEVTVRTATASGRVLVSGEVVALLRGGGVPKGDALAVARIAGIQAAKRTSDIIPLCHPLPLTHVGVEITERPGGYAIVGRAATVGRTGVEMEALVAVSAAALTLYDMLKAIDRRITIGPIRLVEKRGGKRGDFRR